MISTRFRTGAFLLALTTTGAVGLSSAASGDVATAWHRPECGVVDGDGSVTITRTDGAVLARTSNRLAPVAYPKLTALSTPNTLVATSKKSIQRSTDAGCSWHQIGSTELNLDQYELAAGPDDTAYAYAIHDQPIYRVQGDRVSAVDGPVLNNGLAALAVDPTDALSLRGVSDVGQIYDSSDGGSTWTPVGQLAGKNAVVNRAAIDPTDRDHVVLAVVDSGAIVTFDGGRSWAPSAGASPSGLTNGFSVTVSSADPHVVWLEGIDASQQCNGCRHIWRSVDGGRSFTAVLDGTQAYLNNGNPMWPSPVDTNVLYFSYGEPVFGTFLYRYDASTGQLTSQHNDYDGIYSMAFNPVDSRVMYLGLTEEG